VLIHDRYAFKLTVIKMGKTNVQYNIK